MYTSNTKYKYISQNNWLRAPTSLATNLTFRITHSFSRLLSFWNTTILFSFYKKYTAVEKLSLLSLLSRLLLLAWLQNQLTPCRHPIPFLLIEQAVNFLIHIVLEKQPSKNRWGIFSRAWLRSTHLSSSTTSTLTTYFGLNLVILEVNYEMKLHLR